MFLRVGLNTWRVGEIRRESYERAQSILDQMESYLVSAYTDPSHGQRGLVDVIFLSDYDLNGRQRIRFVRSLAGETRHPITREAGRPEASVTTSPNPMPIDTFLPTPFISTTPALPWLNCSPATG